LLNLTFGSFLWQHAVNNTGYHEFEVPSFDFSRQHPRPEKRGVPRFADADGGLFDASYYETVKNSKGQDDTWEDIVLKGVPDPSSFQSFAEYEQALKEWKERAEDALGSLQLPNPMGRCLYRPRLGRSARRTFARAENQTLSQMISFCALRLQSLCSYAHVRCPAILRPSVIITWTSFPFLFVLVIISILT
jgi:hypothetical protein